MKNRSILARMSAALGLKKEAPKAEAKKSALCAADPETLEVVMEFESFEHAESEEFKSTQIKSALKTGKKYKGYLWSEA